MVALSREYCRYTGRVLYFLSNDASDKGHKSRADNHRHLDSRYGYFPRAGSASQGPELAFRKIMVRGGRYPDSLLLSLYRK